MTTFVALAWMLIQLPWLLAVGYLGLLALLSGRLFAVASSGQRWRVAVVVPAHDEREGIAATVLNLLALDYPREDFRVVVVADNCSDDTAARARDAGATVIERHDTHRRGKGYALALAYQQLLEEGWADAFAVVDADTEVSPNLLTAFAARFGQGAAAVQAFYGVRNPQASWRTRLMAIALGAFHRLRGRARERLGVTSPLRGNGMGFTAETLRRVPHEAFSLVEDLEYTVQLGRAGLRVAYADEAEVRGEMVSSAKASESQRQRWEGGRAEMTRKYGRPLLREALRQRDGLLFDLALDVLVPPLARLVAAGVVFLLGSAALAWWLAAPALVLPSALGLVVLVLHVLRGASLSGLGVSAFSTLAMAPAYVFWKLWLQVTGRLKSRNDWVRTAREKQ
jgi:cellulose synthase/poly-beta-1,6-N-acetylglucosamine synthase-like glycosyltransferase